MRFIYLAGHLLELIENNKHPDDDKRWVVEVNMGQDKPRLSGYGKTPLDAFIAADDAVMMYEI